MITNGEKESKNNRDDDSNKGREGWRKKTGCRVKVQKRNKMVEGDEKDTI